MKPKLPRAIGELRVRGADCAALSGREILVRIEAEADDRLRARRRADSSPAGDGADRVRGVLDDPDTGFTADPRVRVDVNWQATEMHRDYCSRPRRQSGLGTGRVEIQ